eukprot:g7253.t1
MENGSTSELPEVEVSDNVEEEPTEIEDKQSKRFRLRILAYLITAVKRFGATFNPTVDFRKRNSLEDDFASASISEQDFRKKNPPYSERLTRIYTQTPSGRFIPRKTRTTSGNKTFYLKRAFIPIESRA